MNANQMTNWDLAPLRARASRERAQALGELKTQIGAWLRDALHRAAPRPGADECLDGCS
jgi:hypothetical protein